MKKIIIIKVGSIKTSKLSQSGGPSLNNALFIM